MAYPPGLMSNPNKNIKVEDTNDYWFSSDNSTCMVSQQNEDKAAAFLTELDTRVKQELASPSSELHIKSEAPNLKWDTKSDDISMKEILYEDLHLKTEIGQEDLQENIFTDVKPSVSYVIIDVLHARVQHMKIHKKEKPFKCTLCVYSCQRRSRLQQHMKIHANKFDNYFNCELCNYTCSQKRCLKQHLQTHMEEKPFKCKVCNSKYLQEGNLHRHMKTHLRVQLFQCHLCDYRCSQKSTLKLHLKTHTRENPL